MPSALPGRYVMSIPEAAEFMSTSPKEIRRWLDLGKITRHQPGRFVVIDRRELETLRGQQNREATDPGDLISALEAAAFADVSKRTIQRYVEKGDLTGYRRHPNLLMISQSQLAKLITPVPQS